MLEHHHESGNPSARYEGRNSQAPTRNPIMPVGAPEPTGRATVTASETSNPFSLDVPARTRVPHAGNPILGYSVHPPPQLARLDTDAADDSYRASVPKSMSGGAGRQRIEELQQAIEYERSKRKDIEAAMKPH